MGYGLNKSRKMFYYNSVCRFSIIFLVVGKLLWVKFSIKKKHLKKILHMIYQQLGYMKSMPVYCLSKFLLARKKYINTSDGWKKPKPPNNSYTAWQPQPKPYNCSSVYEIIFVRSLLRLSEAYEVPINRYMWIASTSICSEILKKINLFFFGFSGPD